MAKINAKELLDLMQLIDDQDEAVFEQISEKIQSFGLAAIPYLESTSDRTEEDIVHKRIKTIISRIRIQNLYRELHNWATMDSKDLLKGYFIMSKYRFPDLNEERVMKQVETLQKEVWIELKNEMTPFEQCNVISKVFFDVKKYTFNMNKDAISDSLCLNALLNSGKGFPDAISVLYTGIAQRLGLPVYGSNLKEAVFLTYVYSGKSRKPDFKKDVKFYLNPFCAGLFFPTDQIVESIKKEHPDDFEQYTGGCKNPGLILRLLNQMTSFLILNSNTEKLEEISLLKKALDTD